MKKGRKNILLGIILFISFNIFFTMFSENLKAPENIPVSKFFEEIDGIQENSKDQVIIFNDGAEIRKEDGKKIKTNLPVFYSIEMINKLKDRKINFDFFSSESQLTFIDKLARFIGWLLSMLPVLFFSYIFIYPLFRKKNDKDKTGFGGAGGGFMDGMNPFGFGKSKAKAIMPKDLKIKFEDVAGIDEAKEDLVEIVDFLKSPIKYQEIGGRIPKGCMLVGEPGTGKTLLAKAIACEAEVPFFSISGSDFVEMFVGVGASRVRDMFAQAKMNAPCIIFIDEIDAVGRHRGTGAGGGNDEREQTLNQLLVEMDGFNENSGIVVLAATNRIDVLDKALLRAGRFDRQIYVNLPDIEGRTKILQVHCKKIRTSPDVILRNIARSTPGFSGADLANIVNESALLAAKRNKKIVTMQEMEDAKDKIMMGSERKSVVMKQEEKELTAYHEGGHALLALHLPETDPIHKATIIPRGGALGFVMRLPTDDRYSNTKIKLESDIIVAMGGRIAEEMIFGAEKVTSGASSDIQQITKIARNMVIKWGLSDEIGMLSYSQENDDKFFVSNSKADLIDKEVKEIIDRCYKKGNKIMKDNIKDLHKLAKNLLEFETLSGDEINSLIKENKPINEQRKLEEERILSEIIKESVFKKRVKKDKE